MRKFYSYIVAAVLLAGFIGAQSNLAVGQVAPVNTVLWSEDFSGYSADDVPSGDITNSHTGTTVYGGVTLTYACTTPSSGGSTTKIYTSGGPNSNNNLLISKNSGTFTISGISTGGASELTITYAKSGKGTISISSSTTGVSISGSASESTITTNGASTVSITFTNTASGDNLRLDDAQIKVKTAGATTAHTLTYSATNGSISGVVYGTSTVVASGASVAEGGKVTVTAEPASSSYKFTSWSVSGTGSTLSSTSTNPTTFTMGTADATVTANFAQAYAVTCATGLANGSISAEPSTAAAGETITITANPDANYKLKTVIVTQTGGSNTVTPTIDGNSATFTMPDYGVTVSATFVRLYHVTYDANTTGYTGTTTDANVYESGASATVQANGFSKDGYTFSTWNTQADGQGTDYAPASTYTIGTSDVTLYAQWSIAKYNVAVSSVTGATVSAAYGNNTIAASANANVDCGTVIQLRADGLASGKGIVWDVYKTGETSTKVTVTNNSFTLPAYNVTISGTVGDLFVKYTAETVAEGDYIIYDSKAMNQTLNDSRLSLTDISSLIVDNTIVSSDASAYTWHIAPNSGYMTISYTANDNTNYVYTTSTTAAKCIGLKTSVDDAARWTFTRSTNTYLITNKTNASTDYANLVNGGSYYACYSKSTKESSLYKKASSYQVDVTAAANGVVTASTSGQSPIAEGANANIRSGAIVTLTATPDDGYIANAWTVYKTGDESTTVTVTSNQFTMPDYPVTVTTSFRSVAPATLTYSANGVTTDVSLTEGNVVTLKTAGEITVPSGYTFVGWSESASDFSDIKTGSYTVMSTITLYAVFSANKPATYSFDITTSDFNTTSYVANNTEKTTTATSTDTDYTIDVKWTSYQIYQNSSAMQWQSGNGYIYNSTDLGTIKSVTVTSTAGTYTTYYGTTAQPSSGTAGTGKGYFKTSVGSSTGTTSKVVVTFEKNAPFYFTRVIGTETATGDITINGPTIIENGKYLNMGSHTLTCTNPAYLVIEDGGQLITSSAVNATVKKNIEAYSSATGAGNTDGWYFIAMPLSSNEFEPTSTMLSGTYDLYYLDGEAKKWKNYRNESFDLANGQGYLYANSADVTLEFAGAIKPYSTSTNTVTLAKDGWNLIGNPFTCQVSVNKGFVELNGDKVVTGQEAGYNIMPCTGVAVYGNKDEEVTFTAVTPSMSAAPGNGSLNITVAEQVVNRGGTSTSSVLDNAIVSFNETEDLPKFNLLENNVKLYIPQGTEEYAIVSAEARGELPVNFKAAKDGEYTLTVNAKDVEMNYLHLIDNLTGADVDLLATPSYIFTARTTDYASRFRLVFGTNNENGASTSSATFAYVSNGQIIVDGTGTLQVIDVLGRIIFTQEITTANGQLPTANYKSGVYVLRLINGSDVKTQKIIVK